MERNNHNNLGPELIYNRPKTSCCIYFCNYLSFVGNIIGNAITFGGRYCIDKKYKNIVAGINQYANERDELVKADSDQKLSYNYNFRGVRKNPKNKFTLGVFLFYAAIGTLLAEFTEGWFLPAVIDAEKKFLAYVIASQEISKIIVDIFNYILVLASIILAVYLIYKSFSALRGKGVTISKNKHKISCSSKISSTNTDDLTLSEDNKSHRSAENHVCKNNSHIFGSKLNHDLRYYSVDRIYVNKNNSSNKDNSQHNNLVISEEII